MEEFDFDDYWVNRGKKFIDDSLENLKKTFERYRTYLNGLSVSTFVGGITLESFLQTTNLVLYLGFIVPVILFQLARLLFDIELSSPSFVRLDPRRPLRVRAAYELFLNRLRKKLKTGREVAAWVTLVGIVCIPSSLFYSLQEREKIKEPSVQINYYNGIAHIKGRFPQDESIEIEFSGKYTKKKKKEDGAEEKQEVDTVLVHTAVVNSKKRLDWQYHITADKNFKPDRILIMYDLKKDLKSKVKKLN